MTNLAEIRELQRARLGKGEDAFELKKRSPGSELIVHPECEPEFQDRADYVLSTGGMYRRCKEPTSKTFIIGTEIGLIEWMRREIPGKTFLPVNMYAECPSMKKITLRNTYEALLNDGPEVSVSPEVARLALRPIERMLEVSS